MAEVGIALLLSDFSDLIWYNVLWEFWYKSKCRFDKTLKYSRRSNLFKYSIFVGKHFKSGIYFGTPFTLKSFRTTCATILKLHNRYHLLISLFDVFPYPFKHLLRTYSINQSEHIVNRKVNFKSKFQWTDSVSLSTLLLLLLRSSCCFHWSASQSTGQLVSQSGWQPSSLPASII